MKNKPLHALFAPWLALVLAVLPALHAAEPPPAAPVSAEKSAPADKSPEGDKPAPAAAAAPAEPPAAPAATAVEGKADDQDKAAESDEKPSSDQAQPAAEEGTGKHHHTVMVGVGPRHHSDNEKVSVFHDSTLAAGEQADAVVSIFGSSSSAGAVSDAVVSVLGSSTSSGEVGDAVVSVVGNTRVTGGTVHDAAVAVLGSTYVNAHIKGDVVAVFGNVELGPDAVVDGQIVCVGGEVQSDPKAMVKGGIQHVAVGGHHFNADGLTAWVTNCLLYGRPLAFGEHLMWAWWIALACLAVYALAALIVPGTVTKCVQTLEERPGKSILAGLLTLLLTPVAYLLLILTLFIGIGFALIPLFTLGLFLAGLLGKAVMLTWIGRRILGIFGEGPRAKPVLAVLIGGAIVLGLYTVPVLGFIVYKLLGILGLGVVLYTLILSIKSNRAASAAASAAIGSSVPPPPVVVGDVAAPPPVIIPSLPPVISAATLPRAGFWIRIAATLLDLIMAGIGMGLITSLVRAFNFHPGGFTFWFAVYNVAMWATKGTTVGGIICGLKLVRLDDRPLDWSVAIVRGLGAFLSLAVAGLGFIWVAFDDGKQSWHDKIAGTTIVRVPKGTSLL